MSNPISFTRVPELIDLIGIYLAPPDLYSCIQVCRLWNQQFIPALWRTIDDRLFSWSAILKPISLYETHNNLGTEWLRSIFKKYGQHIRQLTIFWAITFVAAEESGTVTQLDSLTISFTFGPWCAERRQKLWNLVIQNSLLTSIDFTDFCKPEDIPILSTPLHKALATLSKLTRVKNNVVPITLQWLLEHLPALEYYSCPVEWVGNSLSNNILSLKTVFPQLRTLCLFQTSHQRLIFTKPSILLSTILDLFYYLPNLGQFTLHGIDKIIPSHTISTPDSRKTQMSNSLTSRIHDFRLFADRHRSIGATENILADYIFTRMPQLTTLCLQRISRSGVEALGKYCCQLESITFTTDKYDTGDPNAITPLLHYCTRLKTLDAICLSIEAASLISKPIVCKDLEVFRAKIIRLGDEIEVDVDWEMEEEDDGQAFLEPERLERSKKQHQRIYDELGKLTHLKVLELGVDNVDWYDLMESFPGTFLINGRIYYNYFGPTPNTLKLSLESGLDRLKTLKKLEIFGFEGVDHRIEVDELTWMAENWPSLQVMRGLQEPDEAMLYGQLCPKVKMLREHMQKLRPQVRHEC
ncbi:hypothetical protein FBU30_001739 [Linnemannia zychae]|nr:hypothetical protein FBU30_001739 [Linnemannia zychae]